MSIIKQLPPVLANQIAAGEVIERPYSVVKELLENAIDAGCTKIQIDIKQGGTFLIRIRDNGTGILKEDLPLALMRHATSKIYEPHDLYQIKSLGFRGEALASIVSIAKLTLISKYKEADNAWKMTAEGKNLEPVLEPASHPTGTTIEVRNLFYNVPVRKKFLRSHKTEFLYIEEIVERLALAHFSIGFTLKHDDKIILSLPSAKTPSDHLSRIAKIFGTNFYENATYFAQETIDMKFSGWFGNPTLSRSQQDKQYFYVNGRIIRDKIINHALKQAWQPFFPEGRFPLYALYLEMPYDKLDVNVHPTKHEVRFLQARMVHDFVAQTITYHLASLKVHPSPTPVENQYQDVTENASSPVSTSYPSSQCIKRQYNPQHFNKHLTSFNPFQLPSTTPIVDKYNQKTLENLNEDFRCVTRQNTETDLSFKRNKTTEIHIQACYGKYALILINEQYGIIDLVACFKQVLQNFSAEKITSHQLLIPMIIPLASKEIDKIEKWRCHLDKLGLEFSVMNEKTIAIRRLPRELLCIDYKAAFLALLAQDNLSQSPETLLEIFKKHIAIAETIIEVEKQLKTLSLDCDTLMTNNIVKCLSPVLLEELFH